MSRERDPIPYPSRRYKIYHRKRKELLDKLRCREVFATSYTFFTEGSGWWQIEVPHYPYNLQETAPLDCYDKLVDKFRSSEHRRMPGDERTYSNPNHDLVIDVLEANWELTYPHLKPRLDPLAELYQPICFKEVCLKRYGQIDFAAIIPDGTIIIIEVGTINMRQDQLRDQVVGIEKIVGHKVTILPFFCKYDFDRAVNFANGTSARVRKLTIKPVQPYDGDWPPLRI